MRRYLEADTETNAVTAPVTRTITIIAIHAADRASYDIIRIRHVISLLVISRSVISVVITAIAVTPVVAVITAIIVAAAAAVIHVSPVITLFIAMFLMPARMAPDTAGIISLRQNRYRDRHQKNKGENSDNFSQHTDFPSLSSKIIQESLRTGEMIISKREGKGL